jgi:hypothetical protein
MTGISLVLVALSGQAPAQDAGELVRQLGSTRYAEREASSAALEAIGLAALPALREAGASKDPEVRRRVAAIVAKIECRELKEAWPIRLDVADQPLNSVVEGFGFPSPSRLAWHPDSPDAVRRRRVTIREPAPVPFWAAIDRLCRAGELRYIPGSPDGPSGGLPGFRLFLAPGTWDGPRADSGPLRLEVVRIQHSRHVNLIPNRSGQRPGRGPRPPAFGERRERFDIALRILAEPRMLIRQVGNALIAEAVDDRGQSLLPSPAPYLYAYGYGFGGTAQACANYNLGLRYPERAGLAIKRLRLTIPVEVEALKADRLAIPLADSVGKIVRHGKTSIEILAVGAGRQGHPVVKLKLGTDDVVPERLALERTGDLAPGANRPAPLELSPNVIQVLDQHGRQYRLHVGNTQANGSEVTAELMMWLEGGIAVPVPAGRGDPAGDREMAVPAVLYHTGVARAVFLATFDLHDVPLP